jgi:hypothetical protein
MLYKRKSEIRRFLGPQTVRQENFFEKEVQECKRYVRSYPESGDLLVGFERRAFDYAYRTGVARMSFITMCNVDQNRK